MMKIHPAYENMEMRDLCGNPIDPPKPRGFAAMSKDRLRQVSSEAGKRSTSRPFRDVPGLAKSAGSKKPVDAPDKHDHK